jgi:hypothetical protein
MDSKVPIGPGLKVLDFQFLSIIPSFEDTSSPSCQPFNQRAAHIYVLLYDLLAAAAVQCMCSGVPSGEGFAFTNFLYIVGVQYSRMHEVPQSIAEARSRPGVRNLRSHAVVYPRKNTPSMNDMSGS